MVAGNTFAAEKHSGLGVSSFVISVVIGILMFLLFVVAGVIETSTPGGMDEESAAAMLVGTFMFLFLFIEMLAIGLGIAGLFQAGRKKVFAILGITCAVATIILTILLIIVGLTA